MGLEHDGNWSWPSIGAECSVPHPSDGRTLRQTHNGKSARVCDDDDPARHKYSDFRRGQFFTSMKDYLPNGLSVEVKFCKMRKNLCQEGCFPIPLLFKEGNGETSLSKTFFRIATTPPATPAAGRCGRRGWQEETQQ